MMSGCIAEFGLEAEALVELGEIEAGADLIGIEAIADADELALLRNGLPEDLTGEMTVANEESMNTLLGRIRIEKVYGENPKLYIEGKTNSFAEVYPESGKFRLLSSDKYYSIPDNIFSVKGESVRIRSSAEISPNNILTEVNHGKLLVKLAEKDNWYQIKCVKDSRVYFGWIYAAYVLPIVLLANNKTNKENDFKYPDENKIKEDLIGKGILGWNFDFLSEFQSIEIENNENMGSYLLQTVDLKLKSGISQNLYNSEIVVTYKMTNNGWRFLNVTKKFFIKIPSQNPIDSTISISTSKNLTKDVPTSNYNNKSYISTYNTVINTKMRGPFNVKKNTLCIINSNGVIYGDLILNRGATLTVYGVITGYVRNHGGKISNHNSRNPLKVINYRTP